MLQLLSAIMPLSKSYKDKLNYLIGVEFEGKFLMPWKVPSDLKHFKETTKGTTLIMGYNTWESIGKRMLPGRPHIIITRSPEFRAAESQYQDNDDLVFMTMEKAIILVKTIDKVFSLCGGGQIYKHFLNRGLVDKCIISGLSMTYEESPWRKKHCELPSFDEAKLIKFPVEGLVLPHETSTFVKASENDDCSFTIMVHSKTDAQKF